MPAPRASLRASQTNLQIKLHAIDHSALLFSSQQEIRSPVITLPEAGQFRRERRPFLHRRSLLHHRNRDHNFIKRTAVIQTRQLKNRIWSKKFVLEPRFTLTRNLQSINVITLFILEGYDPCQALHPPDRWSPTRFSRPQRAFSPKKRRSLRTRMHAAKQFSLRRPPDSSIKSRNTGCGIGQCRFQLWSPKRAEAKFGTLMEIV